MFMEIAYSYSMWNTCESEAIGMNMAAFSNLRNLKVAATENYQDSMKLLSRFDLDGCLNFLNAFASICLILSLVTSKS